MSDQPSYAAFIGIDWADENHAICQLTGDEVRPSQLPHTPEAIADWAANLHRQFAGRPVAVMLEQSQGALAHALRQYPQLVLFPLNPKQAKSYREALHASGKKDDPSDAECLARYVREHHRQLRAWQPDDEATRRLARLVELRRDVVEERKQQWQRLLSVLKLYFPLALEIAEKGSNALMCELLARWTTLRDLQRANPKTLREFIRQRVRRSPEQIEALVQRIRAALPLTVDPALIAPNAQYVQVLLQLLRTLDQAIEQFGGEIATQFAAHPDAAVFRSPPGAGAALAPRLLVAFGSDREKFASAEEVQCYTGVAPLTVQSGKSKHVRRRYACNKFLRQTFMSSPTTPANGVRGPKPSTTISARAA